MDAIKEKAKGAVDAAKGATHPPNGVWQSELFDCSKAMGSKPEGICVGPNLMACFCPCIVIAKNVNLAQGRQKPECCDCMMALPNVTYFNRRRIRQIAEIPQEPCGDFCVSAFCFPCAVCQNAREIEVRAMQFAGSSLKDKFGLGGGGDKAPEAQTMI